MGFCLLGGSSSLSLGVANVVRFSFLPFALIFFLRDTGFTPHHPHLQFES